MKNINYFIFAVILTLSFTSCEKDENSTEDKIEIFDGVVNESDLIGEWELIDYTTKNGKNTTTVEGVSYSLIYSQQGSEFNYALAFESSPNLVSAEGSYVLTTDSSINGLSSSEATYVDTNFYDEFSGGVLWELNSDNTLIMGAEDATIKYYIESFTNDILVISYDLEEVIGNQIDNLLDELEDEDADYKIEGITTLTLQKK